MGVEYSGQLCVGYTFDETEEILELSNAVGHFEDDHWEQMDLYEKCECVGLEKFSPYYDADSEDSIFGWSVVSSSTYSFAEVSLKDLAKAEEMVSRMIQEYAKQPKIYIMAEGY